jgi:hypothetical protein
LHRGPGHHRQDTGSSSQEGTGYPYPPATLTSAQSATRDIAPFRRKRIDNHYPQSARMPLKTSNFLR